MLSGTATANENHVNIKNVDDVVHRTEDVLRIEEQHVSFADFTPPPPPASWVSVSSSSPTAPKKLLKWKQLCYNEAFLRREEKRLARQRQEEVRREQRRAEPAGEPGEAPAAALAAELPELFGLRCVYCGKTPLRIYEWWENEGVKTPADAASADHVVPKSRDGANDWTNLVVACVRCNTKKGNKLLETESSLQPAREAPRARKREDGGHQLESGREYVLTPAGAVAGKGTGKKKKSGVGCAARLKKSFRWCRWAVREMWRGRKLGEFSHWSRCVGRQSRCGAIVLVGILCLLGALRCWWRADAGEKSDG